MGMMGEFRQFILRGNVLDLAVGVVIGSAFGAVVNSFVKDLLTPLISIPGTVNFGDLAVKVGGSTFSYGNFLNAVISFLMVAFALFFFVIKPVNMLSSRLKTEEPAAAPTRDCPYCLSSIPAKATRCLFCTSEVADKA